MLKMCGSTGQKTRGLPVAAAMRLPEFGLPRHTSELFRNHRTRVVPPGTFDEMHDLACHARPHFVTETVAAARKKALV